MHIITFQPSMKQAVVPAGTSLLEAAATAGVLLESSCGGRGSCGKCKVKLLPGREGRPSPLEQEHLSLKEIAGGVALACQYYPAGHLTVLLDEQSTCAERKTELHKVAAKIKIDPAVKKTRITMQPPSINDQTADCERLLEKLPSNTVSVSRKLLADLPGTLRKAGFSVTAVLAGDRLIAVEPGDTTGSLFGLAFDIGTTTIMGALVDLNSGEIIDAAAATNPQQLYGADLISRITHAGRAGGREQLQALVISALNELIHRLLEKNNLAAGQLYEAVVAGNTTMNHLFLGVDPTYLAPAPFIPAHSRAVEAAAAELGLAIHPSGTIFALPNIAGYVGSDTVGVLLATRLEKQGSVCLAIDIGTNGEVMLAGNGRILVCSTAAGPAFEGARIKHGMRACEGAIEAVAFAEDLQLTVIGGVAPRGICGSGLIDAAAALLKAGIIEKSGRMLAPESSAAGLPSALASRLRSGNSGMEFVLSWSKDSAAGEDLVITQEDLRELQLAKGAIYAGAQVLLKELGVSEPDINTVFLAGAFGNYMRKESALAIGLLPAVPAGSIIAAGNAAGEGARLALVSRKERARALSLARQTEHIELSGRADFQDQFIKALAFK